MRVEPLEDKTPEGLLPPSPAMRGCSQKAAEPGKGSHQDPTTWAPWLPAPRRWEIRVKVWCSSPRSMGFCLSSQSRLQNILLSALHGDEEAVEEIWERRLWKETVNSKMTFGERNAARVVLAGLCGASSFLWANSFLFLTVHFQVSEDHFSWSFPAFHDADSSAAKDSTTTEYISFCLDFILFQGPMLWHPTDRNFLETLCQFKLTCWEIVSTLECFYFLLQIFLASEWMCVPCWVFTLMFHWR